MRSGLKKTDAGGVPTPVAIEVLSCSIEINIGDGFTNGAFLDHGFLLD